MLFLIIARGRVERVVGVESFRKVACRKLFPRFVGRSYNTRHRVRGGAAFRPVARSIYEIFGRGLAVFFIGNVKELEITVFEKLNVFFRGRLIRFVLFFFRLASRGKSRNRE